MLRTWYGYVCVYVRTDRAETSANISGRASGVGVLVIALCRKVLVRGKSWEKYENFTNTRIHVYMRIYTVYAFLLPHLRQMNDDLLL